MGKWMIKSVPVLKCSSVQVANFIMNTRTPEHRNTIIKHGVAKQQ